MYSPCTTQRRLALGWGEVVMGGIIVVATVGRTKPPEGGCRAGSGDAMVVSVVVVVVMERREHGKETNAELWSMRHSDLCMPVSLR
jgi:hypothetical protein